MNMSSLMNELMNTNPEKTMSKAVLFKNFKQIVNEGKASEETIYIDIFDHLSECILYKDLCSERQETEYDVKMKMVAGSITISYKNLSSSQALFDDLVAILIDDNHKFATIDLLSYEDK